MLIYPLKGRVMVGTTDLEHDMREPAVCTEEEVDYFFDLIAHVFPAIRVERSQIVYRFSGVRPLPRHDDTQPGFVSRDYRIERAEDPGAPGHDAAQPRRREVDHLPRPRRAPLRRGARAHRARPPAIDEGLAIGGGAGYPATDDARRVWLVSHGDEVGRDRAAQLLERYGTRAEAFLAEIEGERDAPLEHHPDYTRLEIAWLLRNERVVHLPDLVLRRTSIAFTGTLTALLLDELADAAAEVLGWGVERRAQEVAATRALLADRHGVRLPDLAPAT